MKKIPAILLIFVLLMQVCVFYVNADTQDELQVKAASYRAGTPVQVGSKGDALMYNGNDLGYDLNIEKETSALLFSFRTGISDAGLVEVRLGSENGPVIGSIDTSKTGAPDWATHRSIISLSQPLSGKQRIYFCVESGPHWFEGFTLIPDDYSKRFAQFKNTDNFVDIINDSNRHEINLLSDLGLVSKQETKFNPIQPMKRIDFVGIIGRLIGAEQYASSISPFKDVSIKDENFEVLCGLYQLGIIKGDTDGNFRPNSFIKPEEAATVCINSLGYTVFAKDVHAALDVANNLDLFDSVDVKKTTITRSEGVKIIYNLLLTDYLAIDGFDSKTVSYTAKKNFLFKSSGFVHGKGVMTANGVTELYSRKKAEGIAIDGVRYQIVGSMNTDYLGIKCEFFYSEENGERLLYAIRPLPKAEINVVTSSADVAFEKINEREIIYSNLNDGEEMEFEIASTASIIYNGTAISNSLMSLIPNPADFEGSITFIDNDADGVYECVWIDHVSRIIKVGGPAKGKISDAFTNTILDVSKGDFWLFIGARGAEINELMTDDILTIYESSDSGKDKFIRGLVKKQSVRGTISQISDGIFTINEERYRASSVCTDDLFVGLSGEFILDNYNQIISVNEDAEKRPLIGGFIMFDNDNNSGLFSKPKAKLFTDNGILELGFAQRVVADGVAIKDVKDLYNGKGAFVGMGSVDTNSPVLYRINENNEITMIDTIKDGTKNADDCLTLVCDSGSYLVYGRVLSAESPLKHVCALSSKAKMMVLPSDRREESYGFLENFPTAREGWRVNVTAYATNRDSMVADLVVSTSSTSIASEFIIPFAFKSVSKKISDIDGEIVLCISGFSGKGNIEYEIDEFVYTSDATFRKTIDSLKEGDMVYGRTQNGKLTSLNILYIPTGETREDLTVTIHNASSKVVNLESDSVVAYSGEIEAVEDTFVKVKIDDSSWVFNAKGASVLIYEKDDYGRYIYSYGCPLGALVEDETIIGIRRGVYGSLTAILVCRDRAGN